MSFRLEPPRSIEFQIRQSAAGRVDDAINRLDRLDIEDPGELAAAVLTVRRRCKQARAIARLARCALGPEFATVNQSLRDTARALSELRAAHVRSALLAGPTEPKESEHKRHAKKHHQDPTVDVGAAGAAVDQALGHLRLARASIDRWSIPDDIGVVMSGLGRTYARARRNLDRSISKPSDDQFHEWRKDVKALWYQLRMIEGCAPSALGPLVRDLDAIGKLLGRDQDLRLLLDDSESDLAAADERRRLRSESLRIGRIAFAEVPRAFVDRLTAYWDADCASSPT